MASLNNKENYQRILRGEIPQSIPFFDFRGVTGPSVLRKDRTPDGGGFDCFGVEYVYTPEAGGGSLPVPGKFMFTDITKWREFVRIPDLSGVDWETMAAQDTARFDRSRDLVVGSFTNGFFQNIVNFMGFTEGMCAMAEDPEEVAAMLDAVTGFYLEVGAKVFEYYKPDLVWMADDICTQLAPFVSVETYRSLFKPYWKKFVDFFRERGVPTQLHCCGNATPLFDDFIDLGFVAWDPLQISNSIPDLKKKAPNAIAFIGGFEMAGIPGITEQTGEEEVRGTVREIIDSYATGGRYAFFGSQPPLTAESASGLKGLELRKAWITDERRKYAQNYYER